MTAPHGVGAAGRAALGFGFFESVKVVKKFPKDPVEVQGDEKLIVDALRRLLDNAVQAMACGGTLTLSIAREGGYIVVEVADTGPGIKPELLADLFEPFHTGKPRGLGLSLAMTRKIAEAHNGRVEGGNGSKGARFRFSLPAAA